MRSDKKSSLKSDKKSPTKKKGAIGFNKKSALLEDAITQMNAGKYGRASSALKDLLALDPLNTEARRLFATLHLRLGSLMSARTAFESLAREAMERQDYWLAESLLREYLTAGPRCVPFLEMLGRVYEEKGDVMAAVAEYGKAVEVLLEDPDTDNPNRASDLFARIRSIAPGSPVAFRFAAMFDTVTGQVLQTTPHPAVVETKSEMPPASALTVSPSATDPAVAMPWEQVEAASSEVSLEQDAQVSVPVPSPETMDSGVRQDDTGTPTVATRPADSSPELNVQFRAEPSLSAMTPTIESVQVTSQSEPPAIDSAPAPLADSEIPSATTVEVLSLTSEVSALTGSRPIADAPMSPAPMPWDQIEDAATVILPPAEEPVSIHEDVETMPSSGEIELPPPASEPIAPMLLVPPQASNHPIVDPPAIHAPMPWDQVEEATNPMTPAAETVLEVGAVEVGKASESPAAKQVLDTGSMTEPPPEARPSETTSSGLTWEEILAAVSAMQSSTVSPQTLSSEGQALDPGKLAETRMAAPDSAETEAPLFEATVSDALPDLAGTAPSLSAPMPWEQIEVDDVMIPRPEPEPDFGPVPAAVVVDAQDSTVVMSVVPEAPEAAAAAESRAADTVADRPIEMNATATSEFRILSPDASIHARRHPIHIPMDAYNVVEESTPAAAHEPEQPAGITTDHPGEPPLRLADSESIAATASVGPSASIEPGTDFAIADDNDVPSPALEEGDLVKSQVPVSESVTVVPSDPSTLIDQPAKAIPPQQVKTQSVPEAGAQGLAPVVVHSLIDDQTVALVSPAALDAAPAPEPETALADPELSSASTGEAYDAGDVPMGESIVPPLEASFVSAVASPQPAPPSNSATVEEPVLPTVESAQDQEAVRARDFVDVSADSLALPEEPSITSGTSTAPASDASGGLRILWDDSSSKPTPSVSTGNMLTRWLRKPADIVPAEAGEASSSVTVPDEPPAPLPSWPVERQEAAVVVTDRPLDQPERSAPPSVEAPVDRPQPNRPAVAPAWRRVGEAIASLLGAGVSTTRSMLVMLLALVGLTLVLSAGAVCAVVLVWLVLEEQPSAAYRNVTSVPQHTLEDSSKNGYFLLLGFGAPATQDPLQAGMDRRPEGIDRAFAHTCLTGDGQASGGEQSASVETVGKWMKTADPAAQMRVEATGVKAWVSQAEVSMGRYRQWLAKPFEDWGYGQSITPNCGLILSAHRLYVAEGFAQDVDAGVARLESDLTAWRTVLGQAKTLSVKMLASTAMNDDVRVVGGLLLRPELDERLVSRLAKLAQPLEQAEQSVRWPMQSQFVLATKTLEETMGEGDGDRPLYGSLAAALPLPKQRRFNAYAQYYEAAGKAAGEGRYADLPKQSQFVHAPPYGLADIFVNPIESLVGVAPLPTWETYAGRVLETDARLRLASLQAWLRRTPREQDLLTRIAKAGQDVYDPFTAFPMLVNMKKGVLYSVGQDLKDNEAQDRFDLVAPIPSSAWMEGKRPDDVDKLK